MTYGLDEFTTTLAFTLTVVPYTLKLITYAMTASHTFDLCSVTYRFEFCELTLLNLILKLK